MTNSCKHFAAGADALRVKIVFARNPQTGEADFRYRDNGAGIDTAASEHALYSDERYGTAGGLKQVVALARELKGNPDIASVREDGVSDEAMRGRLAAWDGTSGMAFSFSIPPKLLQEAPELAKVGTRDQA